MAFRCGFVTNVGDTSLILDLGASPVRVTLQSEFPPPEPRRAAVGTMLQDGDNIAATVYGNRVLKLALAYSGVDSDATATFLRLLHKEITKERNVLLMQFGTNPVWFKTFRAPEYTIGILKSLPTMTRPTLDIPAEPFALGSRETASGSPFTVACNPASANGLFFDVASVKGDVPTPLHIQTTASLASETCIVAVRRHGTPSNGTFFLQAEAMSQSTDTTTQANDATYSGSSNNFSRTTFATTATDAQRMTGSMPAASFGPTNVPEIRGTYRVWARVKKSVSGDTITVHARVASRDLDTVTLATGTAFQWADLGLVQLPWAQSARFDGYGAALGAEPVDFRPFAARTGSGNLDWDYFWFVPADEEYASVGWPAAPMSTQVFDGPSDAVYSKTDAGGGVEYVLSATSTAFVDFRGRLPMVAPNVTNRVFFLRRVAAVTVTTALTVTYWPRYLWINPS